MTPEIMAETHEVLKKLVVRQDDLPDRLFVDCADVMEDENDIGLWMLVGDKFGVWSHAPSATEGSLYECLFGIAACYTPTMQKLGRESAERVRQTMAADAPPES